MNIFFVFLQSVFVAELLVANVTLEAKVFQVNDSDVSVEIASGSKLFFDKFDILSVSGEQLSGVD